MVVCAFVKSLWLEGEHFDVSSYLPLEVARGAYFPKRKYFCHEVLFRMHLPGGFDINISYNQHYRCSLSIISIQIQECFEVNLSLRPRSW